MGRTLLPHGIEKLKIKNEKPNKNQKTKKSKKPESGIAFTILRTIARCWTHGIKKPKKAKNPNPELRSQYYALSHDAGRMGLKNQKKQKTRIRNCVHNITHYRTMLDAWD